MPPNPAGNTMRGRQSPMDTDEVSFESRSSTAAVNPSNKPSSRQSHSAYILKLHLNVWLHILRYLPLGQVLDLPLVCQDFRDKLFNIPEFWKNAYLSAMKKSSARVFLPPVPAWYQGLIIRRWFTGTLNQICDHCYGGYGVMESNYGWLSVQPVRILLNRKSHSIRRERYSVNLCGVCRVFHYQLQPEPFCLDHPSDLNVVSPFNQPHLIKKYALTEADLGWISPHEMTEAFIHIYARVIFGGEVGIEAEKKRSQISTFPAIVDIAESQLQKLTTEAGF